MTIEDLRDYCLLLPGATEYMPFDDETLVFKVCGKIFALLSLDDSTWLNLKCEPSKAIELREQYSAIRPGYHMNKKHWNTVVLDGSLSSSFICDLIVHSYEQVILKLPKKKKDTIFAKL